MPDRQIQEIMQTVDSIHPDASVEEAVQKMSSLGKDVLLIKQMNEYTGIFTKTDLIKLLEKNMDPAEISVSAVMSKPILSIDVSSSLEEAKEKMLEKKLRHYAVTQNGNIVGLLSILDIN
jgi:signal-transduction protein with cAMP-binding, CBS, and nucleotidyltransferase domain